MADRGDGSLWFSRNGNRSTFFGSANEIARNENEAFSGCKTRMATEVFELSAFYLPYFLGIFFPSNDDETALPSLSLAALYSLKVETIDPLGLVRVQSTYSKTTSHTLCVVGAADIEVHRNVCDFQYLIVST
jgi:hypothetical protein